MKELVISPNRDSLENGTQISLVSKCTRCLVRPEERNDYNHLSTKIGSLLASQR